MSKFRTAHNFRPIELDFLVRTIFPVSWHAALRKWTLIFQSKNVANFRFRTKNHAKNTQKFQNQNKKLDNCQEDGLKVF